MKKSFKVLDEIVEKDEKKLVTVPSRSYEEQQDYFNIQKNRIENLIDWIAPFGQMLTANHGFTGAIYNTLSEIISDMVKNPEKSPDFNLAKTYNLSGPRGLGQDWKLEMKDDTLESHKMHSKIVYDKIISKTEYFIDSLKDELVFLKERSHELDSLKGDQWKRLRRKYFDMIETGKDTGKLHDKNLKNCLNGQKSLEALYLEFERIYVSMKK